MDSHFIQPTAEAEPYKVGLTCLSVYAMRTLSLSFRFIYGRVVSSHIVAHCHHQAHSLTHTHTHTHNTQYI